MENDTSPYSFLPSLEWKFPFIFYIFYFDGSPEGIKTKLQSAQRHDQPRWGDFPDKLDLQYLAGLGKPSKLKMEIGWKFSFVFYLFDFDGFP